MDAAKHSSSRPVEDDDAGRTKAAAWAWYQHGKGGSTGGVNARTVGVAVRAPSRFRAEAIKEQLRAQQQHEEAAAPGPPQPDSQQPHHKDNWDCGSSLFDSYELLSLSRQLDHAFTKAATTTLENATTTGFYLEEPHQPHANKLGKMLHQVLPRSPRPLCQSHVRAPHDQFPEYNPSAHDAQHHHSHRFYDYGCQDQEAHYSDLHHLDDHHVHPTSVLQDCDHHMYAGNGLGSQEHAHAKHWSFRRLSRALLMLTHRPTSVSHHSDDSYAQELHHQHQHHHLHHHHHQHDFHHQHEFHHHHHVHHVIHATPKMGYEAASQPPKLGTGY